MAAEAKRGGAKHHVKSSSAPATPQRPIGLSPVGTPERHEKPIPSYLRQTISSCRNASRQSPPLPAATTTTKPAIVAAKKPVSKAPSSQLRERSPKASSPLPKPSASKSTTPKELSKSQSFSRAAATRTKRTEGAKQEERGRLVAPALSKSKSFSRVTMATKKRDANRPTLAAEAESKKEVGATISSPKRKPDQVVVRGVTSSNSNEEGKKKKEGTEKTTGKDINATEPWAQGGDDELGEHEGVKRVVLKRQESKRRESSQPYNEVIEETASKLAEGRNKVLALVGAFETVISLQEPEGQPTQQRGETKVDSREKEEEGKEEEEVNKSDCGRDDREGEKTTNVVNVEGGVINKDREEEEEENKVDDHRTQIRTDEIKEVQNEKNEKEVVISQLNQEEEEEEEVKVENEIESTKPTTKMEECYRVSQESQQHQREVSNEELKSKEPTAGLTESTK